MPHRAGWYVLAVENGTPRQLLGDEEDVVNEFRFQRGKAAIDFDKMPKYSRKTILTATDLLEYAEHDGIDS